MFIATAFCDWKCERECGERVCQNTPLAEQPSLEIDAGVLLKRYLNNPITSAVVFGGLEPMLQFEDVLDFIRCLRGSGCMDMVVIYTGCLESEVAAEILALQEYPNMIVKFGRYVPHTLPVDDPVLGVRLASCNQYAKKLS